MPRPRFESVDPRLKDAIFAAAAEEFATKGYDGASLNRIIEVAGLSKGSFYYYFDDKLDLAATVLVDASFKVTPPIDAMLATSSPEEFWSAVEAYQEAALATLHASPRLMELVARLGLAYVEHPELAARVMPAISPLFQRSVAAWAHGQTIGAVRTDIPLEALLAAIQGLKESLSKLMLRQTQDPDRVKRLGRLQADLIRRVSQP